MGRAPRHEDLLRSTRAACEARLPEPSIFRLLSRDSHRLFPDEAFSDLFSDIGRCSVPPPPGLPRFAGEVGNLPRLAGEVGGGAVATQDTVTLIRGAIRGLLREADDELEAQLRSVLKRDDEYRSAGKPVCDWDEPAARTALVDALARDGYPSLLALDERTLGGPLRQAAEWLATVLGQELEPRDDGVFRIARRVAKDRVISTVDPDARHGHKTAARGFDGYKGHIAIDPDSELITATEVSAGNVADGSVGARLLTEVLDGIDGEAAVHVEVYGDSSYGTAELVEHIEDAGGEANVKVQPPSAAEGMFGKDDFRVDLKTDTVICPAGRVVPIGRSKDGGGLASFGDHCRGCPLRDKCTKSIEGRSIRVHPREATLQRSREQQRDPAWKARYRATRPKVERKLGHLMFRRHGGRRARVRGCARVGHDFALLAAAVNLKRLAVLVSSVLRMTAR